MTQSIAFTDYLPEHPLLPAKTRRINDKLMESTIELLPALKQRYPGWIHENIIRFAAVFIHEEGNTNEVNMVLERILDFSSDEGNLPKKGTIFVPAFERTSLCDIGVEQEIFDASEFIAKEFFARGNAGYRTNKNRLAYQQHLFFPTPEEFIHFIFDTSHMDALNNYFPLFTRPAQKLVEELSSNLRYGIEEEVESAENAIKERYDFLAAMTRQMIDHIVPQIELEPLVIEQLKSHSALYFEDAGALSLWDDIVRTTQKDYLFEESIHQDIHHTAYRVFHEQSRGVQFALWLHHCVGDEMLDSSEFGQWDVPDGRLLDFPLYDEEKILEGIVEGVWYQARIEGAKREWPEEEEEEEAEGEE